MDLNYFSYITGLASLLGFLAQILGWFPNHKEMRRSVLLVILGVFFGSLSSAFNASSIELNISVSGFTLLLIALGSVIIGFLVAAAFSSKSDKRDEFYGVAGVTGIAFMFILLFGGLLNVENSSTKIRDEKSRISISEFKLLSEDALKRKDHERALMHLNSVKARLNSRDSIYKKVEERIEYIKLQQF